MSVSLSVSVIHRKAFAHPDETVSSLREDIFFDFDTDPDSDGCRSERDTANGF